jgi:hypothetical protein
LTKFITTRGVRLSLISFKRAYRISGEFARSISPDTSNIVILSSRRAEICKVFSPFANFNLHSLAANISSVEAGSSLARA